MKLFYLVLCILHASCFHIETETSIKEKIVGALKVKANRRVPYHATFEFDGFACAASIIDSNYVALPASCLDNKQNITDKGQIRVGTKMKESEGKTFSIKSVIPYPDYDSNTLENDLALFELHESISFNENHTKIELSNTDPKLGDLVTISGFGSVMAEDDKLLPTLHVGNVIVLLESDCKKVYKKKISKNAFCVTKGAHKGDEGGPAVIDGKLAGIISKTGDGKNYGIVTKISEYFNWIKKQIIIVLTD